MTHISNEELIHKYDQFTRKVVSSLGIKEACGGIDVGHTQEVVFARIEEVMEVYNQKQDNET